MNALVLVAAVALLAASAIEVARGSHEAAYSPMKVYPEGGVHGGDALVLPLGDIQGVRNIQCGRHTGARDDVDCDIAAGSAKHRGDISFNWDVGDCTNVFDGRKRPIARFCPGRTVFYGRVVFKRRPVVRPARRR